VNHNEFTCDTLSIMSAYAHNPRTSVKALGYWDLDSVGPSVWGNRFESLNFFLPSF